MLTQTQQNQRLRIAIQKKGRLFQDSLDLLWQCGLKFHIARHALVARCEKYPIDLLLVRDDDIPTFITDSICDLGIVGENVLQETALAQKDNADPFEYEPLMGCGFGQCRLAIAFPKDKSYDGMNSLQNLRIATSYPRLLTHYLQQHNIKAKVITVSGSVEIAPRLGMADVICDLVSSGRTLGENNLREVLTLLNSQAFLVRCKQGLSQPKEDLIYLLWRRIQGVTKARERKYILFHAPKTALAAIKAILPGSETPTIVPLDGYRDKVAVHLVSAEAVFWDTLEKLKQVGASSILVLPIEKMMD